MNKESIPPHMQLAVMSREFVVSRAIHAIAHLGIADHMTEEPVSVQELARLTSTVPELLDRVLNFLTVYGLFKKNGEDYALTPLSAPLRQDHPYSMKDVLSMVDESWWQAFAHLETGLKTGIPAFKEQHGTDFFTFLNENAEKKVRFQKGLNKLSAYDDKAITQGYNFSQFKKIIDIGKGQDGLSKAITAYYPATTVDLYNLMAQTENEYFSALPAADAYLLKGVLHDFDNEKIKKILTDCHQHMPDHSSLIIAEQVIPENDQPHTNKTMDIIMMVLVGGRQRTSTSWCEIIESAGFKLKNTFPTPGIYTVMEFFKVK